MGFQWGEGWLAFDKSQLAAIWMNHIFTRALKGGKKNKSSFYRQKYKEKTVPMAAIVNAKKKKNKRNACGKAE